VPSQKLFLNLGLKSLNHGKSILIKIVATAVTASDCIIRSLNLPRLMKISARLALGFKKPRKPILGLVLSGIVENVGDNYDLIKIWKTKF